MDLILKRYIALATVIVLLFSLFAVSASGGAGTAQDPVATLSYIQTKFIPGINDYLNSKFSSELGIKYAEADSRFEKIIKENNITQNSADILESVTYMTYMQLLDSGIYSSSDGKKAITLNENERLVIGQFSSFTVTGGRALIGGDATHAFVNATAGARSLVNSYASRLTRYIVAEEGIVTVLASDGPVTLYVEGTYQRVPVFVPQNIDKAAALKDIYLFMGSNKGFELNRPATRLEALILFLRLIGEENQALAYNGKHPFTDVPFWANDTANKYVAYAYDMGYTKGVSVKLFGTRNIVTAEQYMTFVLRALGYVDGTDFQWEESIDKSIQYGILSPSDKDMLHRRGFYRDLVVYVSCNSLFATKKGTNTQLLTTLIQKGLVTDLQAQEFKNKVS